MEILYLSAETAERAGQPPLANPPRQPPKKPLPAIPNACNFPVQIRK
jgi:hypothetical protein